MEFLVKVFVSILGMIGGDYISIYGVDISLVNRGSGLYDKGNGFYVYKGSNPNNYVEFNDELWRILSIDDNSVKIIKNKSLGNMAFDQNNSNEWNESSLNKYLDEYYDSFKNKEVVSEIEIMSMDDYLNANSNLNLCSTLDLYFKNDEKCFKTNYINNVTKNSKSGAAWTLTKEGDTVFYAGNTFFSDIRPSDSNFGVLPVIYLNKNIELYGKGTLQEPYKIKF